MRKIYQNSVLNIAATWASESIAGCFTSRDSEGIRPQYVYLNATDAEGSSHHAFQVIDGYLLRNKIGSLTPLERRAWVLQERRLAPRVLQFDANQLFWECPEMKACETRRSGLPPGMASRGMAPFSLDQRAVAPEEDLNESSGLSTKDILWQNIVLEYSNLNLAYPCRDRLAALAGVAERMAADRIRRRVVEERATPNAAMARVLNTRYAERAL